MKKLLLTSFLALLVRVITFAQSSVFYASPTFREIAQHHKTLAVLHLEVRQQDLPKNLRKNATPEALATEEQRQVVEAQRAMRTYLLKRNTKKSLGLTVQEVEQTNTLLAQHGINADNLATTSPQQLASLLGVDAIIMGKFSNTPSMSRNTSLALGITKAVTGIGVVDLSPGAFLTTVLYDGATGERIWQFDRKTARGEFAGTTKQVIFMMQSSKHKFPYVSKR